MLLNRYPESDPSLPGRRVYHVRSRVGLSFPALRCRLCCTSPFPGVRMEDGGREGRGRGEG